MKIISLEFEKYEYLIYSLSKKVLKDLKDLKGTFEESTFLGSLKCYKILKSVGKAVPPPPSIAPLTRNHCLVKRESIIIQLHI